MVQGKMQSQTLGRILVVVFSLLFTGNEVLGQQAAEIVNIDNPSDKDLYLAGRSINILSPVNGDAVLAGQRINITQPVSEDVIAAGERVNLNADIGDDFRAAGRIIIVDAAIGDDAILAGESVTLSPDSRVSGRAWIAGRGVELAGQIDTELRAAAQSVIVSGDINGNVYLIAEKIEVLPGARINGDFLYRSPNDANISPEATITGNVSRREMKMPDKPEVSILPFLAFSFLSLLLSVSVLVWLLPRYMADASATIIEDGFKSIGVGFVFALVTPAVVLILLISVLGIPLGLMLLALYLILLFIGFLVGIHLISEMMLRLLGKSTGSFTVWRLLTTAVAIVFIMAVQLVPLVGGLGLIVLFLLGLGAAVMQLYRRYRA
jgi:cytoskeletal protein CcmA (bactofilin family)